MKPKWIITGLSIILLLNTCFLGITIIKNRSLQDTINALLIQRMNRACSDIYLPDPMYDYFTLEEIPKSEYSFDIYPTLYTTFIYVDGEDHYNSYFLPSTPAIKDQQYTLLTKADELEYIISENYEAIVLQTIKNGSINDHCGYTPIYNPIEEYYTHAVRILFTMNTTAQLSFLRINETNSIEQCVGNQVRFIILTPIIGGKLFFLQYSGLHTIFEICNITAEFSSLF